MIAFARTEGRYRMHTKFIFVTGGVAVSYTHLTLPTN